MPASDIILWGMPYSTNIILTALVRFLGDSPSSLFGNREFAVVTLQYTNSFYYSNETCQPQLPCMAGGVYHDE